MNSRLNIIAVENRKPPSPPPKTRREEIQAYFENEWHQNPEQFNPLRHCLEEERINRTLAFLTEHLPLEGNLKIADLGCGQGILSKKIHKIRAGLEIHAIDIAKSALESLEKEKNIQTIHACLPSTPLKDSFYDCVVSTEVIAWLLPRDHRLYFNELSRIAKKEGFIVCSTRLDLHTDYPLEHFASLVETEIEILSWKFSYHRLYIHLKKILEYPNIFKYASKNSDFRDKFFEKKEGLSRWWFRMNSTKILGVFWGMISLLSQPILNWVKKSRRLLLILEKITRIFFQEKGISHVLFIGKKKSLNIS